MFWIFRNYFQLKAEILQNLKLVLSFLEIVKLLICVA